MAPPADYPEDNYWIDDYPIPEDDLATFNNRYMPQLEMDLPDLSSPDGIDSIDNFLASMPMTQAPIGMGGTPLAPSNHVNNPVANWDGFRGHPYLNTPRGDVAMDEIHKLLDPPCPMADSNIEPQNLLRSPILTENGRDEPAYVTDAGTRHPKRARKSSNPSSDEWQRWESVIRSLYIDNNYTLEATIEKMTENGFSAKESMYKRKFKEWGWRKYEQGTDGRNPGGGPSVIKPVKGTRGKDPKHSGTKIPQPNSSRGTIVAASTPLSLVHVLSKFAHPNSMLPNNPAVTSSYIYPAQYTGTHFNLSMTRTEILQSHNSHGISMAGFTPRHNHHARFHPKYSGIGIPASLSIDVTKLMDLVIAKTEDLYITYPAQGKWPVNKQREIEGDEHDDLLVGIATSVRNYSSLSPDVGDTGFQKALLTLGKVVGVGDGADLGLFSLPAIWVSFLRLVRGRPVWASKFLSVALNLARTKFGRKHSLVQVLDNLKSIWEKDPGQVEQVVLRTYRRCISQVKERLDPFNLTYLTLWADYVVYLDGTSDSETYDVVENIRGVIKVVGEEKGPDGGPDSDYVIELYGMMLYVLQSAPTMADEAEDVAKELLERLEQRRGRDGGKLEGDLFTTWKDLRQLLGTFCQRRGDYEKAIGYLEESLGWEIVDDRDILALEKLERCYLSVGGDEQVQKAKVVWQRRMDESQRLLQKADMEPARGEKVAGGHGEGDNKEGGNVSDEGGSSEGTVVCQVEEINEENLGEYNDNEIGDSEVEQQLLREQIAELTKRLNVLEMGKGKGAKVMT